MKIYPIYFARFTTTMTMGTHGGRKGIRKEVIFAIVQMVEAGIKQSDAAARFNFSKSAVSKIIKKHNSSTRKISKKQGRKFKLKAAAIRIQQRIPQKNDNEALHVSVVEFREYYDYKLSIKSIRRYMHECGLRNYAVVLNMYLCFRHNVATKQKANMHKD